MMVNNDYSLKTFSNMFSYRLKKYIFKRKQIKMSLL